VRVANASSAAILPSVIPAANTYDAAPSTGAPSSLRVASIGDYFTVGQATIVTLDCALLDGQSISVPLAVLSYFSVDPASGDATYVWMLYGNDDPLNVAAVGWGVDLFSEEATPYSCAAGGFSPGSATSIPTPAPIIVFQRSGATVYQYMYDSLTGGCCAFLQSFPATLLDRISIVFVNGSSARRSIRGVGPVYQTTSDPSGRGPWTP
jgi:hypothetical protein